MRRFHIAVGAIAFGVLSSIAPVAAQQATPGGLLAGVVNGAYVSGWCAVGHASSTFQRTGMNNVALIDLANLGYNAGNGFVPLDGQVRLTFTGGTSGTAKFKIWGSNANGTFDTYSQIYNGQQYIIAFNLTLPNGCKVPISGFYEVAQ